MTGLWNREPVLFMAVVQAAIALALAFGLHLTTEQVGAILALAAALLGLITRTQVTPLGTDPPVMNPALEALRAQQPSQTQTFPPPSQTSPPSPPTKPAA